MWCCLVVKRFEVVSDLHDKFAGFNDVRVGVLEVARVAGSEPILVRDYSSGNMTSVVRGDE